MGEYGNKTEKRACATSLSRMPFGIYFFREEVSVGENEVAVFHIYHNRMVLINLLGKNVF